MYSMRFYVVKTEDGLYHVQNTIMGMLGQHHVHTPKGFERWSDGISKQQIINLKETICDCGLKAGEVRSHTGDVTFNPNFV